MHASPGKHTRGGRSEFLRTADCAADEAARCVPGRGSALQRQGLGKLQNSILKNLPTGTDYRRSAFAKFFRRVQLNFCYTFERD